MAKQQKLSKSIDVYTDILWKSLKSTWAHPELWIIGALAGLASTGATFNHVFKALWRVRPADEFTFETLANAMDAVPWLMTYLDSLITVSTARLSLTVLSWIVLLTGITIVMVGAQQVVLKTLHQKHARKKHKTFRELLKSLEHWHFWRIFTVDILMYLASVILLAVAALALAALLGSLTGFNVLVYIGVYLVLLPAAFVINVLGMFTLIRVVAKEQGIIEAFQHSCKILHKHWLSAMEVSVLIFFVNTFATGALFVGLLLFAGLSGLIVLSALAAGSVVLMGIIAFFASIGGAFIVVAYGGFMTTFNYSVWTAFEQRLDRYGAVPAVETIIRKVIKRKK